MPNRGPIAMCPTHGTVRHSRHSTTRCLGRTILGGEVLFGEECGSIHRQNRRSSLIRDTSHCKWEPPRLCIRLPSVRPRQLPTNTSCLWQDHFHHEQHIKNQTHICGVDLRSRVPGTPSTLLWYDIPIQKTPSLILSQHHHHHNKFVLIQHHHNDWPRSERATEWTIGRVCACVPRLYHLIVPSDAFVVAFDTCRLHSVAIASRPSLP